MKFKNVDKGRLVAVFIGVIIMGFANSILARCDFGTDPCTTANLGISKTIGWSFGNWQLTFNTVLLTAVLLFARSQFGWGTLANMILVGYSFDLSTWIEDKIIPEALVNENGVFKSMGLRIGLMIPALIVFLIAAAIYMSVQLGTSPYDAIPFIICEKNKKIPFRPLRIAYDSMYAFIGFIFGATVSFVTIAMCLCLGPAVSWVSKNVITKLFGEEKTENNNNEGLVNEEANS